MSVRVKLDNKEIGYYASLYQAVDEKSTAQILGTQAVSFFKRSGLSINVLKKIWLISSENNSTLNKEEFYVALKLISYAQNNIEVSKDSIQRCFPSPLPQFQSDPDEVYKLKPEQERLYQNDIQYLDQSNSTVSTQMAMNLFKKSQATQFQLQNIINLVDPNLQTKPRMTTHSYIVIAHLLSLTSQSVPIPQKLPNSLQEYINQQIFISENFILNTTPINPQPSVIPKSNDLLNFETNFDKSKSPIDKYSAFNIMETPNPIIESSVQKQQQPQYITSQSFQIPSTQTQQPILKQQKQIDIIMNDIDSQASYVTQQVVPQQQVSSLQNTTRSQPVTQQHNKTIDFQKSVLLQEQMLIQQQYLEQNCKEANNLLNEFKESHEQILIQSQSQLESLQTTNEQYKTLLKKISDQNQLFQEELQQIELQKQKLTESLSKQAIEINQKLGLNMQLKQDYSKQTTNTINTVTEYANQIIGDLRSNYEIEQERKKRQEYDIQKELKQSRDQMSSIFEALNSVSKDMKSQRNTSTPYQTINTNEKQNIFVPFQQIQQSQQMKSKQISLDQQQFGGIIDNKIDIIDPIMKQQEQLNQVDLDNKEQIDIFSLYKDNQHQNLINQIVQIELNDQKQQVEQIKQQQIIQQQVEDFESTQSDKILQSSQIKLEDNNEFHNNMIGFDSNIGFKNNNNEDHQGINQHQEQQRNVQFDQSKQFEDQDEEHQGFDIKFEDGFGTHFGNRNAIEQNPSIKFDQGLKQIVVDFDANKEFGGGDWAGFTDNFVKGSQQQKEEFETFKW